MHWLFRPHGEYFVAAVLLLPVAVGGDRWTHPASMFHFVKSLPFLHEPVLLAHVRQTVCIMLTGQQKYSLP